MVSNSRVVSNQERVIVAHVRYPNGSKVFKNGYKVGSPGGLRTISAGTTLQVHTVHVESTLMLENSLNGICC